MPLEWFDLAPAALPMENEIIWQDGYMLVTNIYLRVLTGCFFIIFGLILLALYFNRAKANFWGEIVRSGQGIGDPRGERVSKWMCLFLGLLGIFSGLISIFYGFSSTITAP